MRGKLFHSPGRRQHLAVLVLCLDSPLIAVLPLRSAVLNDAQCQAVWKMASPNGATISQDQAVPYIVNFSMVDGDGDGKISADEFKAGCAKGMVKSTQP